MLTAVTEPSRFIITAEMNPKDEKDFDKWYHEEHLDMLHSIPGHRRSQRYVSGPEVPKLGQLTKAPKYLAIHEYDSLDEFFNNGPEVQKTNGTEWTKKHIQDSDMNAFRMFELVKPVGF
jgi:antibiotic biosynthesis monooxygenase (ABM) superfamily enzyme